MIRGSEVWLSYDTHWYHIYLVIRQSFSLLKQILKTLDLSHLMVLDLFRVVLEDYQVTQN